MSIRVILCLLFVIIFSIYAWKNWFPSLCAALVMIGVLEHPDMPNSIGGIQGLNPWNILIANVMLAWWKQRKLEGNKWDMPRGVRNLFIISLFIIAIGFIRLLTKLPDHMSVAYAVSEYFINTVKWVIPGLLLFDGCRSKERVYAALSCLLMIYILLGIQVIRWMPLGNISGGAQLSARASKITENEIGFNRVTLSMMLGGASWAILSTLVLVKKRTHQLGIIACAGIVVLGQALTGGRTGYGTWLAVGLMLCVLRWRKLLIVIPVAAMMVLIFLPPVRERIFQGLGTGQGQIVRENDLYSITSGRNIAWPVVIKKIMEEPFIGYGREGMVTAGIKDMLWNEYGESFPHPHQAYLQLMLDNGIIAGSLIAAFYCYWFYLATILLRSRNPIFCAVGGVAASLIFALLIGALGGQTFYPREGSVGMWAAIGLTLRMIVELRKNPLGNWGMLHESNAHEDEFHREMDLSTPHTF